MPLNTHLSETVESRNVEVHDAFVVASPLCHARYDD
jgi:hypothetical protein